MDGHPRDMLAIGQIEQSVQVPVGRVHAALAEKPHEVQGPASPADRVARRQKRPVALKRPVGDGRVDPDKVLHDDTARAQVQMAHLAVAHLSSRQSDS
jgi:hypothetical protein